MTVLHLKSKSGPDGNIQVGQVSVGIPNAEVNITFTVDEKISDEQWKKEMRELLDSLGEVHLERLPRHPMKDPWSEA